MAGGPSLVDEVVRATEVGVPASDMLDALVRFSRYAGALERHVISGHRRAELAARDAHTHVLRAPGPWWALHTWLRGG